MSFASFAHGVTSAMRPVGSDEVLTLTIGGQAITGWQRVAVTRPLAAVPAHFSIEVTERYPLTADVDIKAGQPCTVSIGGDLVITGYVDRYATALTGAQHTVRVDGRSKSADLVDCSAFIPKEGGGVDTQVLNGTTLDIVRKIAAPYSVEVQSTAGNGIEIPQFLINLGETCWEIIDRVTRYSQMVVYDLPNGAIMLASVGKESMASGFKVGSNVESAQVSMSMDQRYSDYESQFMSMQSLSNATHTPTPSPIDVVHDQDVPRFRKLFIISEQFFYDLKLAAQRAAWEKNRRLGQSYNFTVTCDSWRDAAGRLWEPNRLAPIEAPQLKLDNKSWIIGTVTFLRDENGQHAQLSLWPPEAFTIEPTVLNMFRVPHDVDRNNPTQPNADAKIDQAKQPT